jgi:rhodanese-related sulfurtransferase
MRSLAHCVDPGLRFERLTLPSVSCEQLQERLDEPNLVVIDVRSAHDYNGGRIRSALSIPLDSLESRISELETEREYCVYDRGATSTLAGVARTILSQAGCNVRMLDGGYSRWKGEGRPTTRSIASN